MRLLIALFVVCLAAPGGGPNAAAGATSRAAAGATSHAAAGATAAHPAARQLTEAFGYSVGEERRYRLEPAQSLRTGEEAWWSIKLVDIRDDGGGPQIVFDLDHERTELFRDVFGGPSGRSQTVAVHATATLNRYGFPERLVITEEHDVSGEMGSNSDLRTTVFSFDGERFVKHVRIDGHEWEFKVAVANHDDLDREARTGLFLFMPSSLRCLGRRSDIGRPRLCDEGEVAFANPGLLSVALPVLWEEQVNEKEFLFFKPTGVGTTPGGLMDMSRWVRLERDQLGNISRYYDQVKIRFEEFVSGVEIGPRTVDAWRVDAGSALREVYVDNDGKVLKVEIDAHPETHGSRWIRLLYPSEY